MPSSTRPLSSWVIDFSATTQTCHNKRLFTELFEVPSLSIKTGDDSDVRAKGKGVNCCKISVLGFVQKCKMDVLLYVPALKYNLLSVVSMTNSKCRVTFESTTSAISQNETPMAEGSLHGVHYYQNNSLLSADHSTAFIADLDL